MEEMKINKQPFQILVSCFILVLGEALFIIMFSMHWSQHVQQRHFEELRNSNHSGTAPSTANNNNNAYLTYEQRIARLETLLQTLNADVEKARNRTLELNFDPMERPLHKNGYKRLLSRDKDFFEKLSTDCDVPTLLLRVSIVKMVPLLVRQYFHFSSNDCGLLYEDRPHEKNRSLQFYNITCKENLNGMLIGHPFQTNQLAIGLPENFKFSMDPVWNYINVIHNGYVDPNGDVTTASCTLGLQRCFETESFGFNNRFMYPLYEEIFVISQRYGDAFYHGTVENIARLVPYLPFLRKYPHIKIHCYGISAKTLGLLDIPDLKGRMVQGLMRGRVVYSPAGTPCARPTFFGTQLLSLHLQHKASQVSNAQKRNVIVLIKRSTRRWFRNHEQILQMLQQEGSAKGLEVKVFGDNPVPDQRTTMDMFHRAVMVVAPHGAGESNLLFSQPGTVVIEALCQPEANYFVMCFRDLSQVLGLRHHVLVYKQECLDVTAEDIGTPVKFYLDKLKYILSDNL